MSEWTSPPRRIPAADFESAVTKLEREHVTALIRRANWLSRRILAKPGMSFALAEFDALVWALTEIAGAAVVNKWLGVIDRTPTHAHEIDEP